MAVAKNTKKKVSDSKARVGGGGVGTKNYKLNLKIAIPLIAVLALVGGYTVLRSFAASTSSTNRVIGWYQACRGTSATNFGGVPYWASELDAGTTTYAMFRDQMKANKDGNCPNGEPAAYTPLAPAQPAPQSASATTTTTASRASLNRVTMWYQVCRGSTATNFGGAPGWALKLDKGTATYATFRDQMKANKDGNCPNTEPGTTATGDTKPGTTAATKANPLQEAQNYVTLGAGHVSNAQKENTATYKRSLKNPVEKIDLDFIAQKEGYVRSALNQMQIGKKTVQGLYNTAVSNAATKAQGPGILEAINVIQGQINGLAAYVTNISQDYKRAERTYEANLNFFGKLAFQAQEKDLCIRKGGRPTVAGGCIIPPPPPRQIIAPRDSGTRPVTNRPNPGRCDERYRACGPRTTPVICPEGQVNVPKANNACFKYTVTPTNARCKSGNPEWFIWIDLWTNQEKYRSFWCDNGFKGMDCPAYYRESSQFIYPEGSNTIGSGYGGGRRVTAHFCEANI